MKEANKLLLDSSIFDTAVCKWF